VIGDRGSRDGSRDSGMRTARERKTFWRSDGSHVAVIESVTGERRRARAMLPTTRVGSRAMRELWFQTFGGRAVW